MAVLSVNQFGKFQILHDGEPLSGVDSRRGQGLWSELVLYRERPHQIVTLARPA